MDQPLRPKWALGRGPRCLATWRVQEQQQQAAWLMSMMVAVMELAIGVETLYQASVIVEREHRWEQGEVRSPQQARWVLAVPVLML